AEDRGGEARSAGRGHAGRRRHRLPQAGRQLRLEEGDEDRAAAPLAPLSEGRRPRPLRRHLRRDQLLLAARGLDSRGEELRQPLPDRKSTRLNSSHRTISYAVFCLKKKKKR